MGITQRQRDVHECRARRLFAGAQHATGHQQVGHNHIKAYPANQLGNHQWAPHMGMLGA
ncbi:hypothetical protein D3C79_903290 [compost metagenome]